MGHVFTTNSMRHLNISNSISARMYESQKTISYCMRAYNMFTTFSFAIVLRVSSSTSPLPLPSSFQLLYSFHSIDIVVRNLYILLFVTHIVCYSSPTLKSPKKPTTITHELLTHAHECHETNSFTNTPNTSKSQILQSQEANQGSHTRS